MTQQQRLALLKAAAQKGRTSENTVVHLVIAGRKE